MLASFPVALQHHLLGTRALPHPPLCDLLPAGYLTSLKRTEARVRFAAVHAGPSGSGSPQKPTIDGARLHANGLSSSSPNGNGTSNGNGNGKAPNSDDEGGDDDKSLVAPLTPSKKSNLHTPHPSNMPLALLRLLEAYIMGFVELPTDRGGWTALQGNRALDVVKGLNACLSEAEGVYAGEWSGAQVELPGPQLTSYRPAADDHRSAVSQRLPLCPSPMARVPSARLAGHLRHSHCRCPGQVCARGSLIRTRGHL